MKKLFILTSLIALVSLFFTGSAFAAVTGDAPVKGETPLLITSAGQGPGGKMARLLVTRSKAVDDFEYLSVPEPDEIRDGGYRMLLVVIGSSGKGLGASGITIDDEITRLERIMESAKNDDLKIIACNIEGKGRRGKPGSASERSIDVIAPYANAFIVRKDGDEDGRFTELAEKNGAPLTFIDETLDFIKVIQQMYQ